MKEDIQIRAANQEDQAAIWRIIEPVIAAGDTYVFAPDTGREKMLSYWCGEDKHCYVATIRDEVLGTLILKNNQPGLGSHVANASYMTHPAAFGRGIGRKMAAFSQEEARKLGYRSMQFNIVVKSNERAVELWKKLGFKVIGVAPEAFLHKNLGYVDACIMWKKL